LRGLVIYIIKAAIVHTWCSRKYLCLDGSK